MPSEDITRRSGWSNCSSSVAYTAILPNSYDDVNRQPKTTPKKGKPTNTTTLSSSASSENETSANGLSCFREVLEAKGIPDEAEQVMLQSWRGSTQKQYSTYLKPWEQLCCERKISRNDITVNNVLKFLMSLYTSGLKYSAINTARSALSCLDCDSRDTIGDHPLIKCFLTGVYESRPTQSRYSHVWDVKQVFDMFRQWKPNDELSLKDFTLKTVMLVALVTAQ